MKEFKTIDVRTYDPRSSIFKAKAKDCVKIAAILCSNSQNCGLFKRGQCCKREILGAASCPYGKTEYHKGPTVRSKSYFSWIEKTKELYKECTTSVQYATKKMTYIGDYVYLPYSFMNMENVRVPFLSFSSFFTSGSNFVPLKLFTLDTIKKIVDGRPQALMGGEIKEYQEKSVPMFLNHLSEVDPKLFHSFIEKHPEYIKKYNLEEKNYIGRTALLHTLNKYIRWATSGSRDGKYQVEWYWNGKELITKSGYAYNSTWGEIESFQNLSVTLIPKKETAIVVKDNSWVNDKTEFID